MKPFTYLLINFFTVIICFIASFDKRIQFYKYFGAFVKAAIVVAIPFIAWDIWFTKHSVWWFNSAYTIGITIAGLPIEECLFFICIPFSCVFTYFCFNKFVKINWADAFNTIIVFISVIVCVVMALLHHNKIYTLVTAVVTTLTLIYLHFIARVSWIGKASVVFFILMLGFLPVNGVLTGTGLESPIVNYNPDEFLGIRILTIPIEDAVYGYSQFLLVVYFFKMFQNKPCEINE
ncbi:lycopene cyclase domain-containing protein [Solitalea sp. MAHUQ-68]|uniref:Lycopene cyclase domain-containing protein n=1 Tax=Solitalea agri TaxID=2953739 RepID=A0A9X2F0U1_9SPHI|nr:lycopene cyclase domain-containing protein [Solitalea agri]MCO4292622.1 lycopene cyclase domain-containing protein [Solitalea agri]